MHATSKLLQPKSTTQFIPETPAARPPVLLESARTEVDAWARHAAAANGFGDGAEAATTTWPLPERSTKDSLQRLWSYAVALYRRWEAYRLWRAEGAALARLDAATLRDLGIYRSEIGSVAAKVMGTSELTRMRVVRRNSEVHEGTRLRINRVDAFL
jgi:uncharacterized protein YjiS (DUF1127 family)